jgi:Methyltransferase domain
MTNPIPIPGWFSPENRSELEFLISTNDIHSVVEVGSFMGLSAVWFARFDQIASVHCVDQWYEGATHESENNLVGTFRRWGYPCPFDFFPLFRANIERSGYWHKIHPVRGHSHYVHREVPVADLVYLDAGHQYHEIERDIEIYRDKARVILCGDDYTPRFEVDGKTKCFGVVEAVRELLPNHEHNGPFWWCDLAKERGK